MPDEISPEYRRLKAMEEADADAIRRLQEQNEGALFDAPILHSEAAYPYRGLPLKPADDWRAETVRALHEELPSHGMADESTEDRETRLRDLIAARSNLARDVGHLRYHRGAHASPTHHVGPCDEACRHGSRIHAHRARRGRG